ncbi:hypothetical protein [Mangrovimicrobium sediminis]|nr:hypothetical protein [Haliea sp. SAOS-164]
MRAEAIATDKQVKSLERDLSPALQNRLDELMNYELESRLSDREAIASAN